MTITYLFAYFFTPAVFHFHIPIIGITFAKFIEFVWSRKWWKRKKECGEFHRFFQYLLYVHLFRSVSNIFKSMFLEWIFSIEWRLFRSYANGTGYKRTFFEAIRPLISPIILFISSTWWGVGSPYGIMHKQSRIFFSAVGATFSNIAVGNWILLVQSSLCSF